MRAAEVLAGIRALPVADFRTIAGNGPLLVLAPHPDDESLGAGGLIAEACARAHPIAVAILTDGTGSHPRSQLYPAPALKAVREAEAREAVAMLGLPPSRLTFFGLRDTASPHPGEPEFLAAAERVTALARDTGARTILATWTHDPHGDHVSAHRIAAAAARSTGARLLSYPVWGWTLADEAELPGPERGLRLDIRAHLPAKRRAIASHRSQLTDLIADDPEGFRMTPAFLALFEGPYEVYLDSSP